MEDDGLQNSFPHKIYFDKYKDETPPAIPYVLKYCMDEIVNRAQSGLIRAHPSALQSLIDSAKVAIQEEGDIVIKLLNFIAASKRNYIKAKDYERQRSLLFQHCHSHVILAAILEFFERIEGGLAINVEFPQFGWLVVGPPVLNTELDTRRCDLTYSQEVEDFVLRLSVKGTKYHVHEVKRDIFIYLMTCLTRIVSISADCFRTKPIVSAITRRAVANAFGPLMVMVMCDCGWKAQEKNCKTCRSLCELVTKPLSVAVMENMFRNIPCHFWQDYLDYPRPICRPHNKGQRISLLNYFFLAKRLENKNQTKEETPLSPIKSSNSKFQRRNIRQLK